MATKEDTKTMMLVRNSLMVYGDNLTVSVAQEYVSVMQADRLSHDVWAWRIWTGKTKKTQASRIMISDGRNLGISDDLID